MTRVTCQMSLSLDGWAIWAGMVSDAATISAQITV
jgi:hypothetical protein